ncbi:protein kinase domain protein, partial [Ichthyophthirius multifiliis]
MNKTYKRVGEYIIETSSKLGSGQYGTVYRGSLDSYVGSDNVIYAIKETPIPFCNGGIEKTKLDAAIREINNLRQLNHPYIVKFIDAKQTDKNIYLIMEYCKDGDLEGLIKKNLPNEKECLYYFSQLVKGDSEQATITGTPLFSSPQILRGQQYTSKSEIWSLGVTLYFMLFYDPQNPNNSYPWYATTQVNLTQNILNNPDLRFHSQKNLSSALKDLLRRMLTLDEQKRMNWDELFSHELVQIDQKLPKSLKITDQLDIKSIQAQESWINEDMTQIMGN